VNSALPRARSFGVGFITVAGSIGGISMRLAGG
jgi:hypothetical protein